MRVLNCFGSKMIERAEKRLIYFLFRTNKYRKFGDATSLVYVWFGH